MLSQGLAGKATWCIFCTYRSPQTPKPIPPMGISAATRPDPWNIVASIRLAMQSSDGTFMQKNVCNLVLVYEALKANGQQIFARLPSNNNMNISWIQLWPYQIITYSLIRQCCSSTHFFPHSTNGNDHHREGTPWRGETTCPCLDCQA